MSKIKYINGIGALDFSSINGIDALDPLPFLELNEIENFWPSFVGDDFTGDNGDPLDVDVWSDHINSTAPPEIQNNKLRAVCGADELSYTVSDWKISGDFSIQVDFDSLSISSYGSFRLQFQNAVSGATEYGLVSALDRGSGLEFHFAATGESLIYQSRINSYGGLKIDRSGLTTTFYYKDGGGSFISISSKSLWSTDMYVLLNFATSDGGSGSGNFDNFTINSGTVIYPV